MAWSSVSIYDVKARAAQFCKDNGLYVPGILR